MNCLNEKQHFSWKENIISRNWNLWTPDQFLLVKQPELFVCPTITFKLWVSDSVGHKCSNRRSLLILTLTYLITAIKSLVSGQDTGRLKLDSYFKKQKNTQIRCKHETSKLFFYDKFESEVCFQVNWTQQAKKITL